MTEGQERYMNKKEEFNAMMDSPEAVDGMHTPGKPVKDSSPQSAFVNGLCQSLKNVNQYRAGMIEKIKNQLGNHSLYFRKKR